VIRDVALTLLVLFGLQVLLARLGHFDPLFGLRYMWDLVARGEAMEHRSLGALFSPSHLRDFFSIHLLIGPLAGLLLIPVALHRVFRGGVRDTRLVFLLACALPPLLASWTYGDSIQGLPRDWDLFAPFALLYVAAAIYCIASEPIPADRLRRLLAAAAIVSLFHTGAWVALNTSEDRSLERYKTLPATRGRTQMVVAYWYLNHGQTALAREWFERSVAAYPANNASQYELGLFDMDEGHYDSAAQRFWIATQARPDKNSYRLALVDAEVLAGHPEAALPELEALIRVAPASGQYWACAGVVLSGLGRIAEARNALDHAIALEPTESRYVKLRERLTAADAYASALREDWDALVLR
jgi:tetratricopeptide (TPR) repeat protein